MKRVAWIVMIFVSLSASAAVAETVMLMPSQDGSIFSESTNSNGSGGQIFVGLDLRRFIRRGLVQFGLSDIPGDATIDAVTLMLTVNLAPSGGATTLSLHQMAASWGEASTSAGQGPGQGNGDAAMMGDATWQHRFFPDTRWSSPGGDFVAAASGSGMVGGAGSVLTVSGAALVRDVAFWLANPDDNHGWILRGDENAAQSVRSYINPVLTVEFNNGGTGGDMDGGEPMEPMAAAPPSIELLQPDGALEFSVTISAGTNPVDIYLGYVTPGGSIVSLIFEGDGLVESSGLRAIERNFVPFDIDVPSLFTRPFGEDDPPGDYILFAALAPAGNDPLDIDGLISLSIATVTRVEEASEGLSVSNFEESSSGY